MQNDALFSALYDAAEQLRVIVTRHEQAAGYMAYGYAAATGRPGAYCVVPGPGDQDAAGIGAPEEPIVATPTAIEYAPQSQIIAEVLVVMLDAGGYEQDVA